MFWCITTKWHQDDDGGHFWDHESTPNHRHERLLMGWAWVQLQNSKENGNAATKPNENRMQTEWQEDKGKQRGGGMTSPGPLVSFFFFSFHFLLLTTFSGTKLELLMTTTTTWSRGGERRGGWQWQGWEDDERVRGMDRGTSPPMTPTAVSHCSRGGGSPAPYNNDNIYKRWGWRTMNNGEEKTTMMATTTAPPTTMG